MTTNTRKDATTFGKAETYEVVLFEARYLKVKAKSIKEAERTVKFKVNSENADKKFDTFIHSIVKIEK